MTITFITGKYSQSSLYLHSSNTSDASSEESALSSNGGTTLSLADLRQTESSIKGHKSRIFVCKCLANLYSCPKLKLNEESQKQSSQSLEWSLKFTGIPVLIHDMGNTKSRRKRQIQLCLGK